MAKCEKIWVSGPKGQLEAEEKFFFDLPSPIKKVGINSRRGEEVCSLEQELLRSKLPIGFPLRYHE